MNPDEKAYIETTGTLTDVGAIDIEGINFVESGKEGRLEYDEYITAANGTIRYYISDGQLRRFVSATEKQYLDGENATLTSDVPEALFEIPSDYQRIS